MTTTPNLALTQYATTDTINWVNEYNKDMLNIDTAVKANQTSLEETNVQVALKANQSDLNVTNVTVNTKVDKGGSGQVTYANLAQDARDAMTGGSVAVVGINAVLTDNIANLAVGVGKVTQEIATGLFKDTTVNVTVENGYYDRTSGTFFANASYQSMKVACLPGEAYKVTSYSLGAYNGPIVIFYNSSNSVIGTTGNIAVNQTNTDYLFTIPSGAVWFSVTSNTSTGVTLSVKKVNVKSLIEKSTNNVDATDIKNSAVVPVKLSDDILNGLFEYAILNETIENGYYSYTNGLFYPQASYKSIKVPCKQYDKFKISTYILGASGMPIAIFYDSNFAKISYTTPITVNTTVVDYEIEIGAGVSFFTVTANTSTGITPVAKKLQPKVITTKGLPLNGLKCLVLGDSISVVENRWRTQFYARTGLTEIACYAVSGAHLCDYADTVLDGTTFTGSGNTICNQVQKVLNTPVDTPDVIIISAGTNDTLDTTQYNESIGTYFVSGVSYVDVNTVDRTKFAGAMRWIVEKLYTIYPNAVIFFATPIQASEDTRTGWNITWKCIKMSEIASRMAVPVIDAGRKSRIYGRYETNGSNGKYLADGLHPNADGGIVLGNFYASEVLNYMEFNRQWD